MSDADNQVGGSGEPFSERDQGEDGKDEPDGEDTEQDLKAARRPRP